MTVSLQLKERRKDSMKRIAVILIICFSIGLLFAFKVQTGNPPTKKGEDPRVDSLLDYMKVRWDYYSRFDVQEHDSFPGIYLIENIITENKYEDFQIVEYINGKFKFYITETMKLNIEGMHYIRRIRFLHLPCNDLPFLEVVTSTRKGHGSYYLYTIDQVKHKLKLCAHVSKTVDNHHESNRSWVYYKGALKSDFEDVDYDSYPDLVIYGWRKLVDDAGEELQTYKIRREFIWDDWDYRFVEKR